MISSESVTKASYLLCDNKGSAANSCSLPLIASFNDVEYVNGAVGLATPSLTGAINESAISHNS